MILVYVHHIPSALVVLQSAKTLAQQLGKSLGVMAFAETANLQQDLQLAFVAQYSDVQFSVYNPKTHNLHDVCEQLDASFLMVQLLDNRSSTLKQLLKDCRNLRIPYLYFKNEFEPLQLNKVLLPVGFLEEEVEKAQFAAAFGRFCGSEIIMLVANDYGSKAKRNADKMQTLFDKFEFNYRVQKASKDSFKVEMEAVQLAERTDAGLVIISASRDYGLDDLFFGPKELHTIRKSVKPVLVVNPRADLYALCD